MDTAKKRATAGDEGPSMDSVMRKLTHLFETQSIKGKDVLDKFLQQVLTERAINVGEPDTPEDQALALVGAAERMEDVERRVALAKRALEIDPNCIDAYLVLSEVEEDHAKAVELLRQGVEAGEKALGEAVFQEEVGNFWSIAETRPYMRVRKALADTLWFEEEHLEAIAHAEELLRLNPDDNLGIRDSLANWYLTTGQTDRAGELFERFGDEPTCTWLLPKALWLFRVEGASERAKQIFAEAIAANPYVPEVFIHFDQYDTLSDSYIIGSEEEAVFCALHSFPAWNATEGAWDWFFDRLRELLGAPRRVVKVGRNDPCPCGSGKKYKRCCLRKW